MTKTQQRKKAAKSLVVNRLEMVSKDVFKKYFSQITDLIGSSPGVYALYDDDVLYYVGKSIELRTRVKQHLKDRHYAAWTHFSLYLVRDAEYIGEMESLLVRIANPKGNRVIPRGKSVGPLVRVLKESIKRRQKEELDGLFANRIRQARTLRSTSHPEHLKGLVSRKTKLFRTYKGKEIHAVLSPDGFITYKGKDYTSPSGAARAVVGQHRAINGWDFWYIKDAAGDWVKLSALRG
ncbi:MAG: DUF2924 domain-containing protein [Betaproteobacteria bacterium]|nr:DUF2924 domain-containing protein [Betaproteobacteria bacterium]